MSALAALLRELKRRPLGVRRVIDGFFVGLHRGPRHAQSLEYAKHRDYYPGDPLKLVDWKLYGKTDRFFVRQYEEQTNLAAWLLIDASGSMGYAGERAARSKLDYAKDLAAQLARLLASQRDLVGLMALAPGLAQVIRPRSTPKQMANFFSRLSALEARGSTELAESCREVAARLRRRSLVFLFSDFLICPDELERALKCLLSKGNDVVVFHVLAEEEVSFPFNRLSLFEDLETGKRLLISPQAIREEYLSSMAKHLEALRELVARVGATYVRALTTEPPEGVLASLLIQRGARRR